VGLEQWLGKISRAAPFVLAAQAMRKNTAEAIAAQSGGEYVMFSSGRASISPQSVSAELSTVKAASRNARADV